MRTLTITSNPDWKAALRMAGRTAAQAVETGTPDGETLNFSSSAAFFSRLTERRWQMLDMLLGSGTVGVRELARRLERDVRRVHDDAVVLIELGLVEQDANGALLCPFESIHIDFHMGGKQAA